MPNWVSNTIILKSEEDLKFFKELLVDENGEATIDFFEELDKEEKCYIACMLSGYDEYSYEDLCVNCDVEPLSEEKRQQLNELIKDFI